MAKQVENLLRNEAFSGKFERIKPRKGKRVVDETQVDRYGKPKVKLVYKPARCLTKARLKKMPQDVLANMYCWFVDSYTAEAVMRAKDGTDLLRVYDCLHLVNLSKGDLKILHKIRCQHEERFREERDKYQRVVDICVREGIHAGSRKIEEMEKARAQSK